MSGIRSDSQQVHRLASGEHLGRSSIRVVSAQFTPRDADPAEGQSSAEQLQRPMSIAGRVNTPDPGDSASLGIVLRLGGEWPGLEASLEVESTYAWPMLDVDRDELFDFAEQYAVTALFNAAVGIFAVELRKFGVRIALPPPGLVVDIANQFIDQAREQVGRNGTDTGTAGDGPADQSRSVLGE